VAAKLFTAIGYLAGTLTTISFVPQLIRTWRCRSAAELSFAWLGAFATGIALWLIYGLAIHSWPIILANALTLFLVVLIVALKCRYR
jgi:MtN3 and saliva related transmembrane protein